MGSSRYLDVAIACVLSSLALFAFVGIVALFLRRAERQQLRRDWREAILQSAIVWAALTFAFTELLSLFTALTAGMLASCWGCTDLILLFLSWRSGWKPATGCFADAQTVAKGLTRGEKALLLWIGASLVITGLIAIVAPPNNGDSMTYHLGRVAHWWADKTIAFYPTNIQRQLYSDPLAEYIILQFYVLGGGSDRLANLVQWFSFGGCAIAVSLLARRLGADRFTQCAAAFIVVTTPICILESTSTQNDLTCALLTASTIYLLYSGRTLVTGLCFGLALLVKSTAGLAVFPFLLVLLFRRPIHLRGIVRATGRIAVIGGIAALLMVPHTLRNIATFGNPLGEKTQVKWVASQTSAFRPFAVNVIRDFGSELGTPFQSVNGWADRSLHAVCRTLTLDLNDPRDTFYGATFSMGRLDSSEDHSANPLTVVLSIAATVFLLASSRLRRTDFGVYAVLVWAGFLLFAWRISWQPWVTRLQVPFLVLSSVPTALLLCEIRRRSRVGAGAIVAVVAVMSLQQLLFNWSRPFLTLRARPASVFTQPRAYQYFIWRPDERSCYNRTIEMLSAASCRVVGIELTEDRWEYPLWALGHATGEPIYFEHIDVNNQTNSAKAGFTGAICATVIIHDAKPISRNVGQPVSMELHLPGAKGAETMRRFDCDYEALP